MKNDGGATAPEPQSTMEALLPRQRQLWIDGERVRVEILLLQYPHLQLQREAVLDLINHEIVLRTELEGPPALEEYVQRFPEYDADLRVLFEVHQAIEGQGENTISLVNEALPGPRPALPDLPHFTFEGILGQGGMGVVYRATDHRLKRTVALKMIRAGGGHEERKRFQSEAEAVAKLDHPHIVHIFDIGDYRGQPFFALEFVDGGSLTQLLCGEPQPTVFAARMVETLARAVHYAHGQGIIHRDLKPGNILLQKVKLPPGATTPPGLIVHKDAAYLPKVADFGLAKHVEPDSQASQTQAIVGTPNYMAPEQAGDFSMKIGPQADVYALGAILYEMITGRPPFRGATTMETLDQVRKLDPVSPCRLQPRCPRDLETICLKCLKKDPAARYATAQDLAEDLGRFLRREPIKARPTGAFEQLLLWCRRNPRVAFLSGSLLTVILLSLATVTWLWQRAARGEASAYAHLYASQINLGQRHWQEVQTRRLDRLLEELGKPPPGQSDLRDFEWYYLKGLLHQDLKRLPGENCVAFSPNGKLLATANKDRELCLWSADQFKAGSPLRHWPAHAKAITSVAFSPQGDLLLSGSMDRTAKLWRVADGSLVATLEGHPADVTNVAYDPKNGMLATACLDGSIRLWDPDGELRLVLEEHMGTVNKIAFSPDGAMLASAGNDGKVRLWDVASGEVVCLMDGHVGEVLTVAFAPDGLSLVSGGKDRALRQWIARDGELLQTFPPLPHWIQHVAFRPDGQRLAVACWDHTIHIWGLGPTGLNEPGPAPIVLRGHFDVVIDIAFHPTQNWLASVSKDSVRVWAADRDPESRVVELDQSVTCCALHPLELQVAVATHNGNLFLCELEGGVCRSLAANIGKMNSIAFSPDGHRLAGAGIDGKVRVWRFPEATLEREFGGHVGEATSLAFDPRTGRLASGGQDGTTRFWDLQHGTQSGSGPNHKGAINGLDFSGDGRWLISGGADRLLQVWNVEANRLEKPALNVGQAINGLAVAPDAVLVAVIGSNSAVDLWDWRRQERVQSLEGHAGHHVQAVAFSHSGARLVTGGGDGNLKLWDLKTGQELLTLKSLSREVLGIAFTRGDEVLVSVNNMPPPSHGQVRFWDSRKGGKTRPSN